MNQPMVPMMVAAPFYKSFDSMQQMLQNQAYGPPPVPPVDFMSPVQQIVDFSQSMQPVVDFPQPMQSVLDYPQPVQTTDLPPNSEEEMLEGYRLYLCKDDFERITNIEADLLKDFLISQMFKATANYQGWSPDFTLKGLQSLYRFEVVTKDAGSRDWLRSLDFSEFEYFHILVYTKEELWYERAAIWLPGHSRVKNIEPLDKLRLQNKKLEGVNVDKWKFLKKIVNEKGTRLYVDMPPSSARALEAHDMKLSYELQQVSVYLKAVAVDKNSFDAGMRVASNTSAAEIEDAIKNAPMPVLANDPALVKIILKGSKTLDLVQARKIKEVVIYNLFRYHQQDGLSRTDFVKYGFLQPNYFAILPMNPESKRWLLGCSFGKVNRQLVVVIGGEEDKTRFFKMTAIIPYDHNFRGAVVIERLKTSNQGVKGINFNLWKFIRVKHIDRKKIRYEVDIDLDSLETMSTMRYQLDYVDTSGTHTVYFRSEYSQSGLDDMIKKCKAEMLDSYDVANMDLDSDQSDSEQNNDVICLD